ncbi:MAG: serine/threonine protein kinase [Solirubrobacterales bacterium]|nr:serine/threonine protein kinase [Solirubrobacterales bacterium]
MESSRRTVPPVVIPVLLVVAIAAYLIGSHRSSSPSPSPGLGGPAGDTRIASGSSVLLEYPAGWQTSGAAPVFAGLPIEHPLLLAPGGHASEAGLLSGQLPAGQPSPLPASFVDLIHVVPRTEVVNLGSGEAYRYSGITGYERTLDVYVVPTVGVSPTALVCYAASRYTSYLQQCEQIVAKATVVTQNSYSLSPDATYATQISGLISSLDKERVTLRAQMRSQPETVATLATRLAARFAHTAVAVAALEPPLPASAAQATLASSLQHARDAYTALAVAAGEPIGYASAEPQVNAAEATVDAALENYALLGYNHT